MHPIIEAYADYDNFLNCVEKAEKGKTRLYYSFYSIRTPYSIHVEQGKTTRKKDGFSILRMLFGIVVFGIKIGFFILDQAIKKPELDIDDKCQSIVYGSSYQDEVVAKRLGICNRIIRYRYSLRQFLRNAHIFWDFVKIIQYLINSKIDLRKMVGLLRYIVRFLTVYQKIDIKNLHNIITENDIFPEEFALIQHAREKGIRTVKGDYFLIDDIYINNINCEYYYYPNNYHRRLLDKFAANDSVKYVAGGYLSWDILNQYKYCPDVSTGKIITFFAQHALVSEAEKNYIKDLIQFVSANDGYLLIIKTHPRHQGEYSEFEGPKVKIAKGGGDVSYELITRSSFTFSIYSVLTLEAKHICKNSYYINYDVESLQLPFDYKAFMPFIDVVQSRERLYEVLEGKHQPTEIDFFIQHVNPAYPNTCDRLKELLA